MLALHKYDLISPSLQIIYTDPSPHHLPIHNSTAAIRSCLTGMSASLGGLFRKVGRSLRTCVDELRFNFLFFFFFLFFYFFVFCYSYTCEKGDCLGIYRPPNSGVGDYPLTLEYGIATVLFCVPANVGGTLITT